MSVPSSQTSENPVYFTDKTKSSSQVVSALAAHILGRYAEAKRFREQVVEPELFACYYQARGEYDPKTLATIQAEAGGCDFFFPLTGPKIAAFKALSRRQLTERENTTFKLEPSPAAELPAEALERVVSQASEALVARILADAEITRQEVEDATDNLYDLEKAKIQEVAWKRVKRQQTLLQDMLVEGGFYRATREAAADQGTFPYCVVKGPYLKTVRRQRWNKGKARMVTDLVWSWDRISPWNFYYGPHTGRIGDDYTIEIAKRNLRLLQDMRGQPGYSTEAIDAVLRTRGGLPVEQSSSAQQWAELDGTPGPDSEYVRTAPEALVYYGDAYGQDLLDWGVEEKLIPDANSYYEIFAEMVGPHVVHAGLDSAETGGRPPYWGTVFQRIGDGPMGQCIPMLVRSSQRSFNFFRRAAVNNGAFSSVPDVEIDLDAIDGAAPEQPYPGMYIKRRGLKLAGGPGTRTVDYHQQESHVTEYMAAAEKFQKQADNDCNIPQFLYGGDPKLGGGGDTLGGLQLLTDQALAAIEEALSNVETDMTVPSLSMAVRILNHETKDESLRGDCVVVPCGIVQQTLKKEMARRQMEFVQAVDKDQVVAGLVDRKARIEVYRKVAVELELPAEKMFPEEPQGQEGVVAAPGQVAGTAVGMPVAAGMARQPGAGMQSGAGMTGGIVS